MTSIGMGAFEMCLNLSGVTFEKDSKLTEIESGTFFGCDYLTSIEIPAGVTSIGILAFYSCSDLTSVTFEEGSQLSSIGEGAFQWCTGLTDITIPDGVTSIRSIAFKGCEKLGSITFTGNTAPELEEDDVFGKCAALTAIYVPYGASGYTAANLWPEEKIVQVGVQLPEKTRFCPGESFELKFITPEGGHAPWKVSQSPGVIREVDWNEETKIMVITVDPSSGEGTISVRAMIDMPGVWEYVYDETMEFAVGHSYKDGKCTVCGTADPDYKPVTDPTDPDEPTDPTTPTDPTDPTNPTDPTDPAKPEQPGKPSEQTESPQTGDSSNMMLWISLMLVSCGGVLGMLLYRRKKAAAGK